MFCKNCGKEMSDNSAFCNNCGAAKGETISSESLSPNNNTIIEDNVLRLNVMPTFNWGYQLLLAFGRSLVTLLIIEVFFIDILYMLSESSYRIYGILIIAIVFLVYLIILFFRKMQYKRLNYKFFKTKVEYADGFLNKEEKEVKYKHIREVTMTQNILERIFNLGKIHLFTNATSGLASRRNDHQQTNKNGIHIHCITNVHDTLKQIKEIMDAVDTEN